MSATKDKPVFTRNTPQHDREVNIVTTLFVLGFALALALGYQAWDTIVLVLRYWGVIG